MQDVFRNHSNGGFEPGRRWGADEAIANLLGIVIGVVDSAAGASARPSVARRYRGERPDDV